MIRKLINFIKSLLGFKTYPKRTTPHRPGGNPDPTRPSSDPEFNDPRGDDLDESGLR